MLYVPAYAKINLSLDILGVKPNGYHELEMILQTVSLCDHIYVSRSQNEKIRLTSSAPGLPLDCRNIAYRAAQFFLEYAQLHTSVHIHIDKRIPSQAGLGGGSADGAAVLRGLSQLFGISVGKGQLSQIAEQIGADVPFCLYGGAMMVKGIGENLSPLPPLPDCLILLAKPVWNVNTKEAYRRFDAMDSYGEKPRTAMIKKALRNRTLRPLAAGIGNVMEAAAGHAIINELKTAMLSRNAFAAGMSGSGSAVFGLFTERKDAEDCLCFLKKDSRIAYAGLSVPQNAYEIFPES